MEKYHITPDNAYNCDEKGFLMGLAQAVKRIMTREAYESGKVKRARQDGSREFLTLIAFVSAMGVAGEPLLIYQGLSQVLMDTWIEDVEGTEGAFFTVTEKGWSDNSVGLQWLKKSSILTQRRDPGIGEGSLLWMAILSVMN